MKAFKRSSILFAGLAAIPLTIALVFSSVSANNKAAPSTVSQQNMSKYKKAYIAGGCFWCVEAHYEKVPGVIEVISGYSGGEVKNPSYKLVSSGSTKHVEAIEIIYDANKISYNDLLTELWHLIDPTDAKGSFSDRGKEYRSVIFYNSDKEKSLAEQSIDALDQSARYNKPIATDVLPFKSFYPAEELHQNYYKKNPLRYKYYRYRSGRDQYLEQFWGNESHKVSTKKGAYET